MSASASTTIHSITTSALVIPRASMGYSAEPSEIHPELVAIVVPSENLIRDDAHMGVC